ncbi:MAG: hypothetical protein V1847_04480 [Candidatus Diapherotrites archaeon]
MGLAELKEAQAFPFSQQAERVVKGAKFSLDDIPFPLVQRAVQIVESVGKGDNFWLNVQQHEETLEREVLAFPVAKILLSLMKNQSMFERFAEQVSENAFEYLEQNSEKALDLCQELGIPIFLAEKPFWARISLNDFLQAPHGLPYLKLVNARVEGGKVFLNKEELLQFLKDAIKQRVRASLPISIPKPPIELKQAAALLASSIFQKQQQAAESFLKGKLELSALPPCFAHIYEQLLKGENVNHSARFNISAFFNALGMPKEQIVQLFKRTPNWNERVARYQVDSLVAKKYTPANCDTMRSYNLCIQNGALCPGIKTPRQMYKRNLYKGKSA